MPDALRSPSERPLRDVSDWAAWFGEAPIPVLAQTAARVEALRPNEDDVDARLLARSLVSDPLMTLKLLVHVARGRRRADDADIATLTAALVLLGISPFFRACRHLPTVEDHLRSDAHALVGLRHVLRQADRAATFALAIAVHRMDHDAAEIQLAALLHDFGAMLLWCHAPTQAAELARRLAGQPGLRADQAQRGVLGIELADLQQCLMTTWGLPPLLTRLSSDRHAHDDAVRSVRLAVRLAGHTTVHGWDDTSVQADVHDIATLLQLGPDQTLTLLQSLDA